ncbi:RidA family protein [Alkaliphilus metalliredigens]|uniref:RidA family protein n=1 Tax=Alkaliphilus metalliredigens TaxID=208226 RepID=UPI000A04E7C8
MEGDIGIQSKQCFKNLFNVYLNQFSAPYPARTTIGVASLPLGAKVEIEMIAQKLKR